MAKGIGTDQPLSRAEILAAIDYEVAAIEKEQASPGWTKWTFFAGFASLVWIAIAEASREQFTIVNSVLILLACSVLIDIAEYLISTLKPDCSRSSTANRFMLFSQHFSGSRLSIIATVLRLGFLIGAYCFLHRSPLHYRSGWFIWFYSVLLAILIVGIFLSYVGFPVKPRKSAHILVKCILHVLILVPLFTSFYQAITKLFSIQASLTASDFRLGLICTIFLWLLPVCSMHVTQHQPLLDTLKSIRRDLAFDRIDSDSALRQADIALDGMRAEDYFQSDLQHLLERLDSASKAMRELQNRICEANSLLKEWEHSPPAMNGSALAPPTVLRAVLESCTLHRKKIDETLKLGEEAAKTYWKKRRLVSHLVGKSEIARIEAKYKSFFKQVKGQWKEIEMEERNLSESLASLAKKSPHLLPRAESSEVSV